MNSPMARKKLLLVCLLLVVLQDGFSRYQVVSDHRWWTTTLMVWSTLPLLVLVWGGFWELVDFFRRTSNSRLAALFGGILFFPLLFLVTAVVLLLKAGSYYNDSFERHSPDNPRYAQEFVLPKGRVYSWVMGTAFFGFPGVCGYFERPIMAGFYFRQCLCYQDQRGTFEIKRLSEDSVACVINGQSEAHTL
jgi:hypothetical protein